MCNFAPVKRELYIFNPENDMALGCGRDSYNAPTWTQRFRHDLELLPAYIAPAGSLILVQDAARSQAWLDSHELDVEAVTASQLRGMRDIKAMPWGWSMPLCKELTHAGLHESLLPSPQEMHDVRQLAHRRTSIAIHEGIRREMGREFSPIPVEISDAQDVIRWALEHPGCYVKTPWSGSGRGIYRAIDADTAQFARWCRGAIARQGSVLCEQALDRVMDMAMEFRCTGGKCSFVGYSVFSNDGQNQYGTGTVATVHELHDIIAARYPAIDDMRTAMQHVVERIIAPRYDGYLGVDMLLYRDGDSIEIDPCVEVNLRCTMGLVTSVLGERHNMRGQYAIVSAAQAATTLTPVYSDTRHTASLFTE